MPGVNQSPDASAARVLAQGATRAGPVLVLRFTAALNPRYATQTLYGPRPSEAAKAICDATLLYPEHVEVLEFAGRGDVIALQDRRSGQLACFIYAEPPTPSLGLRLMEALAKLERVWRPIQPLREILLQAEPPRILSGAEDEEPIDDGETAEPFDRAAA